MLKVFLTRSRQGYHTIAYPEGPLPELPPRYAGQPLLDPGKCPAGCRTCVEVCPVEALSRDDSDALRLDIGRCLFCRACETSCPRQAISFSRDFRMAAASRRDLVVGPKPERLAQTLTAETRRLFGRSLKLRQVSAGGCNACELDTNVLGTIVYDLGRFGIQFVASPRHADGILVTGPVSKNMEQALLATYEAVPTPKIVVATGACAIAGGPYIDHLQTCNGVTDLLPVDLFVPGCPPHPLTILDGLLRLLGRIKA